MKGVSAALLQRESILAAAALGWGMGDGFLPWKPSSLVCPWEETMVGTSWWLDGRAGMAEMEAKAPAQQISKGMKGGCSRPVCPLAEATTSLSPNTSWLVSKHLQVAMDVSHLAQCGRGTRLGCFKGNLHLSTPESVPVWPNWAREAFLGA